LSEVDETLCIWCLTYDLDERRSVPFTMQATFLLLNLSFLVVTPGLEFSAYRWFFLRRTICRKLKLTAHLHLVPSQRMRGGIPLLHSNEIRYLLYRSAETIWPAPVPGCNSGRLSLISDSDYPYKVMWKIYVPHDLYIYKT